MAELNHQSYTNPELAQDYFEVASQYAGRIKPYKLQRRVIARSPEDIAGFYNEHGSLSGLEIKGLPRKHRIETIGILELILKEGVEEARRIVEEERIKQIQKVVGEKIKNSQKPYLQEKRGTYLQEHGPTLGEIMMALEESD